MTKNELRIGVWVNDLNGTPFRIEDAEDIADFEQWENAYPIPITEEWLLKFGFQLGHKLYWIDERENAVLQLSQVNSKNSWWDVVIKDKFTDYGFWLRYVNYVHQLQNLYFALTGTELEIKQP